MIVPNEVSIERFWVMGNDSSSLQFVPVRLAALDPTPQISVLMPNKNYGSLIEAAIKSIQVQTYPNWELIVCDDGSDDESVEQIQTFAQSDKRIRFVRHEESRGMAAALNSAFRCSSGEILCFLDSDDTCPPERIQQVVNSFVTLPRVGILVHPLRMIDQHGQTIGLMPFRTKSEHGWIGDRVIQRGGRWGNMPGGGINLRREVAELLFPIPQSQFRRSADAFLYTLAPLLTEIASVNEPLYNYRIHGANDMQRTLRDEHVSRDEVASMELATEAVNKRLAQLGFPQDICLELERNLNYRQHRYLLKLFSGEKRLALLSEFQAVARALGRDDLYRPAERFARVIIYGVAIPLPVRVRRWWLLLSRSPRRVLSMMLNRLAIQRVERSHRDDAERIGEG